MSINAVSTDALRVYFSRVKPLYRELFNMAHAICGDYELAEYAVQRALLTSFVRNGRLKSRVGFRENLRAAVRREAVEQALLLGDVEMTWDGFREDAIDGAGGDPILQMATLEGVDARRILMLRHGCGLGLRRIARVLRLPRAQVASTLDRFARRAGRRLPARERGRVEGRIAASARAWLAAQSGGTTGAGGVPDAGTVYRSFEAEVMQTGGPGRGLSRVLAAVVAGLLAILCAGVFWLTMVLLQSPPLEEAAAPVAVEVPAVPAQAEPASPASQASQASLAEPASLAPLATDEARPTSGTFFDYMN